MIREFKQIKFERKFIKFDRKFIKLTCFWHIWQYHLSFCKPIDLILFAIALGVLASCFGILYEIKLLNRHKPNGEELAGPNFDCALAKSWVDRWQPWKDWSDHWSLYITDRSLYLMSKLLFFWHKCKSNQSKSKSK